MATEAAIPFRNTNALLSFLVDDDMESKIYALKNIEKNVDYIWHELINHLELLIELQSDPNFTESNLVSYTLAKIFYHKEDYQNSLNYLLLSGNYFDVTTRGRFEDRLLAEAIDRYSAIQQHNYIAANDDKIVMDQNLETVVNSMFETSKSTKQDVKIIAGIAVECRRLDVLENMIKESADLSQLLNHLFYISQNCIQNKSFRESLIMLILKAYSETVGEGKDAWNICHCHLHLGQAKEASEIIIKLINEESDDSSLLALQISSDIQEGENQNFTECLLKELDQREISSSGASEIKEKVREVLSGSFRNKTSYKFLSQNNRSNKDTITTFKKFWDKKNSIIHSAIISSYAIMHAGTLDDTYLEDESNKEWVQKCNHWSKFLSTSSLGTIHRNNPNIKEKLSGFLPGTPQGNGKGEWVNGGALYALGLAKSGFKNSDDLEFLAGQLTTDKEALVHGACLGIGLIGMSSYDAELVEKMKPFIYNENATMGESAAYGIGLVMAGKMDIELMDELFQGAKQNSHEKIIRGVSIALSLMCYQHEEQADTFIEQMLVEKDHLIRYGGCYALGMAYVGTGNHNTLAKLLRIAASDVSDDVRKASAMAIGFVMINHYKKVPKVISLLANSYNPHVRYGAAIALGISCANTNFSEAITILKGLEADNTDFVRQGVAMSMALVLQQATNKHEKNVEPFRLSLIDRIKKKGTKTSYKFGAMIALGILEAGGRNALVKLRSESGACRRGAVVGMLLFTQFWYWFPMLQMFSLCLEPTLLMGLNKDLKIPKGFEIKCNTKKSTFDYPPINQAKKKEEAKVNVVLSTTRRVQAKQALKTDGTAMDEETKGTKTVQQPTESATMDEEKKDTPKDEATKKEEEVEEDPTCILKNPSRILRIQERFIEFIEDNRYKAILNNRKRGYVFLKDTRPEEPEEYVDDEPLEAWLIPPPDFYFDESMQE